MTKFEALSKLGLNINATDEQIRIAYRTLVKKYHPDQFIEGSLEQKQAEEKMKEINEAKETLDKIFKNEKNIPYRQSSNSYQQTSINIEKYKRKMVEKLSRYNSNINNISELDEYYDKINMIILSFEALLFNVNNITLVNSFYDTCKDGILKVFDKLKKELFKKYGIDESKITETINYECNLEEFYKQLLKIKEKYDLKELYRKKIEQDLSDYKLRAGYDYLKGLIEISIDNILKRLKRNNYTNYEEELNKGKEEIDKIFEDYFSYLTQFNQIQEFLDNESLNDTKVLEIYTLFKNAWNYFNDHVSLYDTGENLGKINSLIEKYKRHKQLLKELESLNDTIKTIINNYNIALQSFTFPYDLEKAELATTLLNEVFSTIKQAELGFVPIESCKRLINLKFINYDDKSILNSIVGTNNSKNIYIRNCDAYTYDDIILGQVINEDEDNITMQGVDSFYSFKEETIDRTTFENTYISITSYIKNSNFCGYEDDYFTGRIILYHNDIYSLVFIPRSNVIHVKKNATFSNKFCNESLPFKNVNYLIDYIDDFFRKKVTTNKIRDDKDKKRGYFY